METLSPNSDDNLKTESERKLDTLYDSQSGYQPTLFDMPIVLTEDHLHLLEDQAWEEMLELVESSEITIEQAEERFAIWRKGFISFLES